MKGGFAIVSEQSRASLRHSENSAACGSSARSPDCDMPCLRACGHGRRHLRVGVYREVGRRDAAERDLCGLSEADSSDRNGGPNRAAGWSEADDLRRHAELLVVRQRAA